MKKRWYDFLWILSLTYLVLGFFNILFAWLGLLCFFIPLILSVVKGSKGYCNRYCGRGQLSASDMWLCPVLRCVPTVGSQGNHSALPSGGRLSVSQGIGG